MPKREVEIIHNYS